MLLRHVLSAKQFSPNVLRLIIEETFNMRRRVVGEDGKRLRDARRPSRILSGYSLVTCFDEPSTRTHLSFNMAARQLGMHVESVREAKTSSSFAKKESIEDFARVISGYVDGLVLRHPEVGSAERASAVSTIPVINAGDGVGEHPTQALLDLFTIVDKLPNFARAVRGEGSSEPIVVSFVGDLANGRTVHSLVRLLSLFPQAVQMVFVTPPPLSDKSQERMTDPLTLPEELRKELIERKIEHRFVESLAGVVKDVDVIYTTRLQRERMSLTWSDHGAMARYSQVNPELMEKAKSTAIVMHPLPRNEEIHTDFDKDPRAVYFEQAHNGLYVRMALLLWVFGKIG